jgi:hypothetical protein
MTIKRRSAFQSLTKKSKRGFRGYPVATVAFYGKDDTRASKCVVSILMSERDEDGPMDKWFSDDVDLRFDDGTALAAAALIERNAAKSVVVSGIIGCPHEDGVDYDGDTCPECPYWRGRDRWRGAKPSP